MVVSGFVVVVLLLVWLLLLLLRERIGEEVGRF